MNVTSEIATFEWAIFNFICDILIHFFKKTITKCITYNILIQFVVCTILPLNCQKLAKWEFWNQIASAPSAIRG